MLHREPVNLDKVIEILHLNSSNDFHNCMAITGGQGLGKSTLTYQIAMMMGRYSFNYETNYIGNPEHRETFRKLYKSEKKSVCWIDEASTAFCSENRLTKEQTDLANLFDQIRSHNKTIILCTPSFQRIDKRWRDTYIHIWICVIGRGKAILLMRRNIQSRNDVWGLEEMWEKERTMDAASQASMERILQNFDANPAALFYFTFPDWETAEAKEEYLKWKTKSQADLIKLFEEKASLEDRMKKSSRAEIALGRLCEYLMWKHDTTYDELGKLTGYSKDKIRLSINSYVELFGSNEDYINSHSKAYFPEDYAHYVLNQYKEKQETMKL